MKYFSSYFWFSLITFTINQLIEKLGVVIPIIHSYLDDLLCPGIVLGFALAFQQQLTFRNKDYTFSKWHAIVFVVWYSFLFELLFPYFDKRHHSDFLDIIAYTIGSFAFMKLGNKGSNDLFSFSKVSRSKNYFST